MNQPRGCQIKCEIEDFKNNLRTIHQMSGNSWIYFTDFLTIFLSIMKKKLRSGWILMATKQRNTIQKQFADMADLRSKQSNPERKESHLD